MARRFSFLAIMLTCGIALAQYGRAPNGYYPSPFSGDIFSGRVTAIDESTGDITIAAGGSRPEMFVGRLRAGCAVPSKDGKLMTAPDIPIGTDITAFFQPNARKGAGLSGKDNSIIGIMFHSWNGHPVKQQAKKMYSCAGPATSHWLCFDSSGATCLEPPHLK